MDKSASAAELALMERRAAELRAMLVEANERLVLAMLKAEDEAELSAERLGEATRAGDVDALTGLANRTVVLHRLDEAIRVARDCGGKFALLFVDLNSFKQINDTLGHSAGDQLLRLAAGRMAACAGGGDVVARYGGDEFLVLLASAADATQAIQSAEALIASLGAPHRVGSHVVRLAASIGISLYPEDGEDVATLIELADVAMYHAKRRGLSSFAYRGMEQRDLPAWEAPALESLQQPISHYEVALQEHERRHAQMREANEQLLMAALDARDLQTAAESANRQQTEFLATLAHELRNPLAPIRNAAAMLSGVGVEELPKLQAVIERQGAHMARLVGDLMDLSRVNTGKLRLLRQRADLAPIIDSAVQACRPAMDTRLQAFTIQLPLEALEIDGDPVRLAQVLSNLLDNASKYTPDKGRIGLLAVRDGQSVVITVSDSGIGISADALPRIFAPFVQDEHAVVFNSAGLGIGLTVVKELVEAHGGTVSANSEGVDKGSQFTVTLPLL